MNESSPPRPRAAIPSLKNRTTPKVKQRIQMRASRIPIGIPLPPPNSSSTTSATTNRNIIPPRRPPLLDQTNLNAINHSLTTQFSIEKHPMSISSPTKEESNASSSSSLSKGVSSPPLLSLQEIKYLATSAKKTMTCPKQPRLLDHSNNTINNNNNNNNSSSPPILSLQEIKYLTTCSKRNQHTTIHESSLDDVKRRLLDAPSITAATAANDLPPTYYRPTSILSTTTTTTTTTPTPLDTKYICEFTTTQTATELVISLFQEEQRILGSITSLGDEKKGQQQGGKGVGSDSGNGTNGKGSRRINSTLFIKHGLLSTLTKEMENIMRNRLKSLSTQVVKDSSGGGGGGEPIQMIYTSVYWIARARFEAYHGYMNTAWSCLNEGSIFLSKSLRVGSIRKEIGIKNKCRIEEAIVQFQEKMKLETFGGTSRSSSSSNSTSNSVGSSENSLASSCSNCETFGKENNVAVDEQSSSMTLPESIHDLKMQKRTDIRNNEDDSSIDTDNDETNNDSNIPTTTSTTTATTTATTTKEQKVDGIDDLLGSFIGLTIASKHKDRSQLTPVRRSWRRRSMREKRSESQDETEYNHDTAFVAESSNKK